MRPSRSEISTSLTETINCQLAENNSLPLASFSPVYCICHQKVSCFIPVVYLLYFLLHIKVLFVPLIRDRCYFWVSHSNSNSRLPGLDFLCLTSPKMPPRYLSLNCGSMDGSLPLWQHPEMKIQQHSRKKSPDNLLSLSRKTLKEPAILVVSIDTYSCGSGLLKCDFIYKHILPHRYVMIEK